MRHSKSILTKKNSVKNFWFCHFFTVFAKNGKVPEKNFTWEKFSISRFSFQNTFQNILNRFRPKKFFRPKFFTFVIFCYFGHFGRKTTKSHEKNFTLEKIFDFEIFILKYVSNYSESIPTKKKFRSKFFTFVIFSLFWPFWPKTTKSHEKKIYAGKNFRFRDFRFKIRFKLFRIDSDKKFFQPKFFGFAIFLLFWPKMTKFEKNF